MERVGVHGNLSGHPCVASNEYCAYPLDDVHKYRCHWQSSRNLGVDHLREDCALYAGSIRSACNRRDPDAVNRGAHRAIGLQPTVTRARCAIETFAAFLCDCGMSVNGLIVITFALPEA